MKKLLFFLLTIIAAGCKEKYQLPFTSPDTGYLVIEGVINKGPGPTYIALSRTNKLNSTAKRFERGATVQVEGNDNSVYGLVESGIGGYTATLNLNDASQYRLRIKTVSGKEYLSDYVAVKVSPAVDSISWKREPDGVQLYINTHDPQNKTQYYQWDYSETWEFHSAFRSELKFVTVVGPFRTTAEIAYKDPVTQSYDSTIYKCWRSAASNLLTIGTSAKLSQDLIFKPFLFIPAGDRRLSVLYSINLRQYALTKAHYEFLEKMKKNTEENGSIFDPQPSQLKGNIRCVTDANEPVIGFISVSSVEEKRLFIRENELPLWNYRTGCEEQTVKNDTDSITLVWNGGAVPTTVLAMFGNRITYFGASSRECVDCTLSGTNVKPVFWP